MNWLDFRIYRYYTAIPCFSVMQKLLEFARNIQVEENNVSYEILYPV